MHYPRCSHHVLARWRRKSNNSTATRIAPRIGASSLVDSWPSTASSFLPAASAFNSISICGGMRRYEMCVGPLAQPSEISKLRLLDESAASIYLHHRGPGPRCLTRGRVSLTIVIGCTEANDHSLAFQGLRIHGPAKRNVCLEWSSNPKSLDCALVVVKKSRSFFSWRCINGEDVMKRKGRFIHAVRVIN